MVLNALNHKEKVLQESILWSHSFDSFEDPLLIVDQSFNIIRSNKSQKWVGQKCFQMMFNRNSPCQSCPIKKEMTEKDKPICETSEVSYSVDNKFNLHSFPFKHFASKDRKIWIHHYESQLKMNQLKAQSLQKEKFSYCRSSYR